MRNAIYENSFIEFCEERNLSSATAKVYRSNVKTLLEDAGKSFNSPIGPELTDPTSLGLYFDKAAKRYGEKNLYAIKNKILAFRDFIIKKSFDSKVSDGSFPAALSFLVKEHQVSVNQLAIDLKIPVCTLNRWVNGECLPDYDHLAVIPEMEKYFKLPAGALALRLGPCVFGQKMVLLENKKRTSTGEKILELMVKPYCFQFKNWPQKLKDDVELIRRIYSSFQSHVEGVVKTADQFWKINKVGKQPSYDRMIDSYERLFGFMLLPKNSSDPMLKGLGLKIEDLNITALFNAPVYSAFMDFYAYRQSIVDENGNRELRYSHELEQDLKRAQAFLNTNHGIIPQISYLAKDAFILTQAGEVQKVFSLDDPQLKSKWQLHCASSLQALSTIRNGTRFTQTRDPKEALGPMIDAQDVFDEVRKYVKAIEAQTIAPGQPAFRRAVLYRDFLISLFHIAFVFRSDHFSVLKLNRHLKKGSNGLWRFYLYEKDFKVGRTDSTEYSILDLPADISRFIDVYIKEHRPLLLNPESDYFFLPSKNSNHSDKDPDYLLPKSISKIVTQSTLIYSSSESGFGSHAIRNLTSTACYQEAWDAYAQGAGVLGHSVETNKKHYTFKALVTRLRGHIVILQKKGVLETPKEILDAKAKEKDTLQEMKAENEKLKKMLEMALTLTKKSGDNHESL